MSLGVWFRDYLYIPLGGNRVPKARWYFNIFIVWFSTGFWHGASWNFIIWGLYFAVLLVFEKMWLLKKLEKSKLASRIYVLFTVLISFVIFNASDMKEAFVYIGGMFGIGGIPFITQDFVYYLRSYAVVMILAVIGATPFIKQLVVHIGKKEAGKEKAINVIEPIVLVLLMVIMTAYLVDGSFNPFLYFRF